VKTEKHRKILPVMWVFHLPNFPYGKGGFDVSGRGGVSVVTGCHLADVPRAILAVILVGVPHFHLGGFNEPPSAKGEF